MFEHSSLRERADARANRLRVMDAARTVFATEGMAAEVKKIADLAGVGVGTVYRAFGNKQDLLTSAVGEAAAAFDSVLTTAEAEPDAVEAMRALIRGAFEHSDRFGWLFQLVLADREMQRLLHDALGDSAGRADHQSRVRRIVERGIESGVYRRDLPVDVVLVLIRGALLSLADSPGAAFPQPGRAELIEGLILLLLQPSAD